MFEYRKWGNGSSYYEVILKTSYSPLTKRFSYKSIGMVEKQGKKWVAVGKEFLVAKTRKEVSEMLVDYMENKSCMLCGNENHSELEETTLYSDGDGNEAEEIHWICKEEKGCSNN